MEHKIEKDKLYDLYIIKDLGMKEVADMLGVGVGTIHRHIHKEGIEIRQAPEHSWNSGKTYKDDSRILAKRRHPRYTDGHSYPSDFHRLKKVLLPCSCEVCGKVATLLHHIDKNKHNNLLENLKPLCGSCHTTLHNKERKSYLPMMRARGFKV